MPKILYVTQEMERRANNIGMNASELLESQNQVTSLFSNMGRDFSGQIPSLMTEKIIAMESDYQEMNMTLTRYMEFLEDAARNMEWTDEESARWAASLGNGGA